MSALPFAVLVAAATAAMSVVWLIAMGWDKRAATRGRQRVPEATLHLLEVLGGWPGSVLGSRLFRHKTIKPGYRILRTLCIVAHVAAVFAAWSLLRPG